MRTALTLFLIAHGLLHLAIWLPHPQADPGKPPPFRPDHSALLTATDVRPDVARRVSLGLAVGAGAAFLLTAIGIGLDASWAAPTLIGAAVLGLLLKLAFFSRWLLLAILIDGLLLGAAILRWPVSL